MNLFVWSSGQFIVKGIAVAYMYVCMYVADFRGGKESHCPPKVMLSVQAIQVHIWMLLMKL